MSHFLFVAFALIQRFCFNKFTVLVNITNFDSGYFWCFSEFRQRSLDFLDQCFRTNEEQTQRLLLYGLERCGEKSCLSLAYATGNENLMAHVSCQTLLAEIWTGDMKISQYSHLKVRIVVKQNNVLISLSIYLFTYFLLILNVFM